MCLAIPGRIESIDRDPDPLARRGRVRFGSLDKEVNLALVPEAGLGDYVLVHVGVALQRIDAAEAARVFEALAALGEVSRTGRIAEEES